MEDALEDATTKHQRWDDAFYVQIYLMRTQGLALEEIRVTLGASKKTWKDWIKTKPALMEAYSKGKASQREAPKVVPQKDRPEKFSEYVYGQMSLEVKRLWDEIEGLGDDTGEIKELLHNSGKKFRQGLFVYALTESCFNMTEAMQKAYINLETYKEWLEDDVFKKMIEEISFHRKNFFENALMSQVRMGETSAVIFANKAQNKDRGYGDQIEHLHSGNVSHSHVTVNLNEVGVSLEDQRKILDALKDHARLEQSKELSDEYSSKEIITVEANN